MPARHLLTALVFQFAFCAIAIGQSKRMSNVYLTEKFSHYTNMDASLNHGNYFTHMAKEMGLSGQSEMVLAQEVAGANGYVHYKFHQVHESIPVFGNTYILHEKNGQVVRANGHYSPNIQISTTPSINGEEALKLAKFDMKARRYDDSNPVPVLCLIDPAFPKVSEELRLAYQIDLQSVSPFDKRRYFVDAHHGEVITHFPLILQEGVPSTAQTKYYGMQHITTDSIGPGMFVLHDPTRGQGITVYDAGNNHYMSATSHWDLTNELKDEVALDAHYCTEKYYDMMLGRFGWDGLDGNGGALVVNVHNNGAGNVNAYWNGVSSNYGDGNCIYGPLTTLEVVAHEFTHGMIDHTSKLVYSSESGAINESLADMFGKALEFYEDPGNFSWELGHSFHLSPKAEPFRVLDDPLSKNMPAFYKGEFWQDGGGVHTNSSIGNLWFSMLVEGRQDTNEVGVDFNVPALGMDKASQIAFYTNKNYLTESSDYHDFYESTLQAAEVLFGAGAAELTSVSEAWKAVGLPYQGAADGFDLSVEQPFVIHRSCTLDEYITATVQVTNVGAEPYLPSMNAEVTLSNFYLNNYSITLADTILPGEIYTLVVEDYIITSVARNLNIAVDLILDDDNDDNDASYIYHRVYAHQSSDLRLSLNVNQPDCFSPIVEVAFFVINNSCDTMYAGTPITLTIENLSGGVLWSEVHQLNNHLGPQRSESIFHELDLGIPAAEELNFGVVYTGDPDQGNNVVTRFAPILEIIDGDYLNGFSTDPEMDFTLAIESYSSNQLVTYQGESYFGSTGVIRNAEDFANCPNHEDSFDNTGYSSGINTTLRNCVDFSAFANPYLSFDLVQFRNEYADAEGYLYSSMLQAHWYGTDTGKEIIAGQAEGEIVQHGISLPAYFKGEVEFKFYTELGQVTPSPANLPKDDFVLMDHLQYQTDFTATSESERGNGIQVSPNPANGVVSVRSEELLTTAELRDVNGSLLKKETVNSTSFHFDISAFGNGIYLLRLQNADGAWAVKKVVKLQ